ncbi:MAG: recombination mediator RecR [Candidatus Pacearchaeota archaeon]|nr:recombination mediator RecR [Candidatus Pacearchaeota archaeon]
MTILERLIHHLSKLPGLGKKSASRIAYYLLNADTSYTESLSRDIKELKEKIKPCHICGNYTEENPCSICTDPNRDKSILCIIEQPKDIQAIESSHGFQGLYHVLNGVISPIDGVGPEDLTFLQLFERLKNEQITEIIIATNPTVEGETTALYLVRQLQGTHIKITRIALGIPLGGDLEYADSITLARALKGRNEIG